MSKVEELIYQAQVEVARAWSHCARHGSLDASSHCAGAIEKLNEARRILEAQRKAMGQ